MTRVTPGSLVRAAIVRARSPASVGVVCIFQLAATTTSRMGADHPISTASGRRGWFRLREPLDPFEGTLDGRSMELEAFGELRERGFGGLAARIRDEAHDIRLFRHPSVG